MGPGAAPGRSVADTVRDHHPGTAFHGRRRFFITDRKSLASSRHPDSRGESLDVGEIALHLDELPSLGADPVERNHGRLSRLHIKHRGDRLGIDMGDARDDEGLRDVESTEKGRVLPQRGKIFGGDRVGKIEGGTIRFLREGPGRAQQRTRREGTTEHQALTDRDHRKCILR